ncbi:MAG: T9SS type A sorting domain-containing protein [Bacteroidia bacterium]|nr:T9SS type A sorting domain-containing protein [Bacteroidia bacterium]
MCSIKITAQKNETNDSLKGFDSTALKQFAVQNNLNSAEEAFLLSKKKREFKNAKYNLAPSKINQSAKLISSNNSVMAGNLDFEAGNLSGWSVSTRANVASIPLQTCCITPTANAMVLNGGFDPNIGFNLTSPLGGNWIARLNSTNLIGQQLTSIENTIAVTASNNYLKIATKYILERALHSCDGQPFVNIKVTELSGNTVLLNKFIQASELANLGTCAGSNFYTQTLSSSSFPSYYYNSNWDVFCVDLSSAIGNSVKVELSASECSYLGHGGYAYFDVVNTITTYTNNIFSINGNNYPITTQPYNIGVCNSNTAIAVGPASASSYYWQGTGINGLTTQSVQINQAGSYTLNLTIPNGTGCTNLPSVINFTVGSNSNINVTPIATVVCGPSPITFTMSGATTYSISSSCGYSNYTNATNISVTPTTSCTYFINGFNIFGCSATKTLNITVNPLPVLSITGNTFCSTGSGTIIPSGADTYTYAAIVSNNTISSGNQLVFPSAPSPTDLYFVTGTNTLTGCKSTYTFYPIVYSASLSVSPNPNICIGNNITLTVSGAATTSYTWSTGSNSPTITLNPTVTTNYTVYSNNFCGNLATPFTLTVNPLPNVTITGPTSVCPGNTYTWSATGANTYSFINSSGSPQTGTNPTYISSSVNSNPTITVIAGDLNGCQNTASIGINTLPSPTVDVNGVQINPSFGICLGDSFTLTAGGANTYTWNTGSNSNSFVITPTTNVCFSYSATATNGCKNYISACVGVNNGSPTITPLATNYTVCNGNPINLGQLNYQCCNLTYSVDNQFSNNVGSYIPTSSGVHTLSVENSCAITQATFNVNILPTPTVTILAPDSACINSVVTITLGGATNYLYNTLSGNYSTTTSINSFTLFGSHTMLAYGSYTNGCYSAIPSPTYFIKALLPPTMTVTPPFTPSLCAGSPITLSVSSNVSTYTWSTGSFGNSITLSPTSNTVISVASTGTNGCSGSISKTITAVAIPTINASASPTAVCIGNSTNLSCNGANTYTWSTGAIGNTTTVTPTVSTLYSVTGYSTNNSCPATQTVNVVVNPLPATGFSQPQFSVCLGETAVITVTGAANYNVCSGPTCTFSIFNVNNTFTFNVIGYSAAGCSKAATTTLNVLPNPTVSVSNATTCSGAFATLTASGANSYTWSSGAFTNTTSVNPPVSSQYTVTGADLNNCKNTQIGYVFVNPSPTLYVSSSPTAVCVGNTSNLNVFGAATYTWSTGANTNAIAVTPSSTSVYSISGTSGNCTSTKTIAVIVNTNTSIAVTSTNICIGNSANLFASNVATTYSWSTGAFTPSINVTPTVNTTYTVSGDDANGCFGSAIANVSVQPFPIITVTSSMPLVCAGQSVTLTASGANTYTWSTLVLGPAITATLFISTNFGVTGTSSFGCSTNTLFTQNVSLCTGIAGSSALEARQTIISPNPSSGIFNIIGDKISENMSVDIYNTIGQLLFSQKISSNSASIDLSKYASGLYYFSIRGSNALVLKAIKE